MAKTYDAKDLVIHLVFEYGAWSIRASKAKVGSTDDAMLKKDTSVTYVLDSTKSLDTIKAEIEDVVKAEEGIA